jgi:predicted metal-dependent hydrolase
MTKKQIQLNDRNIEYTLKTRRNSRRVSLAIHCDGSFVVTAPKRASSGMVENFIIQKAQWVVSRIDYFKSLGLNLFHKDSKADYLKYKESARLLVEEKLQKFNEVYKFTFKQVSIKRQKTRWGSCSKKGNLNFNYKIALLPENLADYLVVHELCHLKEFNHSQKFWNLVGLAIPDYKARRRELKKWRG